MAENCIQIVAMGDSSGESEEKYEIYEAGQITFAKNFQQMSKMSGSKPRYKQSYREAWESMRDFKGWLSSVPGNTSKAYCKLCQKELHCHRLSLLKHKVTFKHQKKEEEHKLSKPKGDKNDPNGGKGVEDESENTEENSTNLESNILFEMEGETSDVDDNAAAVVQPTTSEICDTLMYQGDQEKNNSKVGGLSTHVLDVSKGVPGSSVHLVLYKLIDGRWTLIQEGVTNADGRYNFFNVPDSEFSQGRFKLHFDVDKYFEKHNQETIFPFIEIVFDVKDVATSYHIPLLLSPYGYSTYKGS